MSTFEQLIASSYTALSHEDFKKALDYLKRAEVIGGMQAPLLVAYSLMARLEGRYDDALEYATRAASFGGRAKFPSLFAKAEALLELNRLESAYNCLQKLGKSFVGNLRYERLKTQLSIGLDVLENRVCELTNLISSNTDCYAALRMLRGDLLLRMGDDDGWADYEYRYLADPSRNLDAITCGETGNKIQHWKSGQALPEDIIVIAEQGLGDTVHFLRYAQQLMDLGVRVTVAEFTKLHWLINQLYPEIRLVQRNAPLNYRYGASFVRLLSIPERLCALGIKLTNKAPSSRTSALRTRTLRKQGKKTVGFVFNGNPDHPNDRFRSVQNNLRDRLLNCDRVDWVSFEWPVSKHCAEFDTVVPTALRLLDYPDDAFRDFIRELSAVDHLLTVDSAPVHVAGSFDFPCTLLLSNSHPDYRWGRASAPRQLYPSVSQLRSFEVQEEQKLIDRIQRAVET